MLRTPAIRAVGITLLAAAALQAAPFSEAVRVPSDPDLARRIVQARKCTEKQAWPQAVRLLQTILDADEEMFIEDEGKLVAGRNLAHNLIGELPAAGRAEYERLVGLEARNLLELGLKNNDLMILAQVSRKYLHTEAGLRALELVGTRYLDRGEATFAALHFEKLLQIRKRALAPQTLLKAVIAFRRAGMEADARAAWQTIETQAPKGVKLGERDVPLDELKKHVDRMTREPGVIEWPVR